MHSTMQLSQSDLILIERACEYFRKYGVAHEDLIDSIDSTIQRVQNYRHNYETDS